MSRMKSERIQVLHAEIERLTVRVEDAERAASTMSEQLKEAHQQVEHYRKMADDGKPFEED